MFLSFDYTGSFGWLPLIQAPIPETSEVRRDESQHKPFPECTCMYSTSRDLIRLRGGTDKQLKENLARRCCWNLGLLWYNHKCTHGEYKTKEKKNQNITRGNSLTEELLALSANIWLKRSLQFFSTNPILYLHYIQILEGQAPLLIKFVSPVLQLRCLSSINRCLLSIFIFQCKVSPNMSLKFPVLI